MKKLSLLLREIGIKLQQQDTMKLVMKQEKQKSY